MQKPREQLQKDFTEDGEKIILSSLKLQLEDGLDPNKEDSDDNDPCTSLGRYQPLIILAINYGSIKIVKLLINYSADVNILNWFDPDEAGWGLMGSYAARTPLMAAIVKEDVEIVKLLLAHGADANFQRDYYCMTPLMLAVNQKPLLVSNQKQLKTLAFMAINQEQLEIVELLVEHGARIDDRHEYTYKSALMFTFQDLSITSSAIGEYLLKKGAKTSIFGLRFTKFISRRGLGVSSYAGRCWHKD